jgi:translation initiation factor 2 subunit 1
LSESQEDEDHSLNEDLNCRLYRKDFPEEGDKVITEVVKVHENGAYVVLLEFENIEALIPPTEVTKKRVKSVNKYIKVGKQETMIVIRVDKEKKYIDLSKKKVQPGEAEEAEKRYKKAKKVHNIMKQVAVKLKCKLIELYEAFGWDMYDKYEHAYDAFRLILNDPDTVFNKFPKMTPEQK